MVFSRKRFRGIIEKMIFLPLETAALLSNISTSIPEIHFVKTSSDSRNKGI